MDQSKFRTMSNSGAMALLREVRKACEGTRSFPPELKPKIREIDLATRNAQLFLARVGAVDQGMVRQVVELKLELDTLLARWGEREAAGLLTLV